MKLNNKFSLKALVAMGGMLVASSCQMTNLDINTDPNRPASASFKLLLPNAELATVGTFVNIGGNAAGFAGQLNSADDFDLNNNSYNGTWNGFYQSLQSLEEIIKASNDQTPVYRGIAQTLKAMSVGNMVDMFGDIPYSEAWKGNSTTAAVKAPKFDKDSEIYEDLLKTIDEAIVNLARPQGVAVEGDVLFGGSAAAWGRVARSVKIRLLLQSRKGRANGNAQLAAAFAAGGFITTAAQNFNYGYSSVISPQDNRHPWFQSAYLADNGFSYISHQLMGEMILNKDPRLPFYFWRQTSTVLNPNDPTDRGTIPYGGTYLPLRASFLRAYKKAIYNDEKDPTTEDISYLAGFFGRDRGDNTGAPADGALRTAPGTYPAGGMYSGRTTAAATLTGAASQIASRGNGMWPIITSWNMKFFQVEAILDGTGTTGDARELFNSAMREQIAMVVAQGQRSDSRSVAPAAAEVDAYVNKWLELYDAAPSNAGKLNVVAKQIWFSSWGQGIEIWNLMRRTGYPAQGPFAQFSVGVQSPILRPKRQFALRLPYPAQEGNLNPNASKFVSDVIFDRDPIFWDKVKTKWEF
jgi:Starch-binding associating with outer membrane/Susd and RagB outer membrane lipoprotein